MASHAHPWCRLSAVVLVAALNARLAAQAQPVDTNADVLVLDHDFTTGVDEVVRVFLENRQVYRAELSTPDVTLMVRSFAGRGRPLRVYPIFGADSPSGASVVEVYPDADGEYEIRPVTRSGSGVATRLRLFRDVGESHRRTAVLNHPGWEIGLEVAAGWHTGFVQSNGPLPPTVADPHSGTDVEACFTARSAPGIPRLAMCALGIGYESQTGAPDILWVYTEPRLRIIGKARRGHSNWEAGVLFRFGAGSISRSSAVPVVLGPGAYLARHIRTSQDGEGWSIQGSYTHATYKGFPTPLGTTDVVRPHSDRLTLGLGWYR